MANRKEVKKEPNINASNDNGQETVHQDEQYRFNYRGRGRGRGRRGSRRGWRMMCVSDNLCDLLCEIRWPRQFNAEFEHNSKINSSSFRVLQCGIAFMLDSCFKMWSRTKFVSILNQ
ncbi:hypothetical protein BLOT_001782 [Blomia tropicalis]|nr:hypothetical protein BLOT_001782 [Blomia tropicalis]